MFQRQGFLRLRPVVVGLAGVLCLTRPWAFGGASAAQTREAGPARFLLQWGKQGSEPGEFHFPIGIAIDRHDAVFVSDHYNGRLQKFDQSGHVLAVLPVLPNPGGVAVDARGDLYVTHFGASRLQAQRTPDRVCVYSANGRLLREWGHSGTGDGEFDMPGGVAIDRDGRVYVADQTNRRVQVFDRSGRFLSKWGEYGTWPGQFGGNSSPKSRVGGPQFVALDSGGGLYTTEASLGRVQKFTPGGKFLLAWGDNQRGPGSFGGEFQGMPGRLQGPIGICVDPSGRVWVSAVCGRIQQFSSGGRYLAGFGAPGSGPGEFLAPHGIALDSRGDLYVVDAYNHRVQKFALSEPAEAAVGPANHCCPASSTRSRSVPDVTGRTRAGGQSSRVSTTSPLTSRVYRASSGKSPTRTAKVQRIHPASRSVRQTTKTGLDNGPASLMRRVEVPRA